MEQSAGQALVAFREDPRTQAIVEPLEAAFVDATRLAGLVAGGFVLVGVAFSLLLPSEAAEDRQRTAVSAAGPAE